MTSTHSGQSQSRETVQRIRGFNRFYTKQIGVLQKGWLESPYSLMEVRLLYELGHGRKTTASELSQELGIDAGYLSRILANFQKRGWITRKSDSGDRRQAHLTLTARGQATLRPLEERSNEQVQRMLDSLSPDLQEELVHSMMKVQGILSTEEGREKPYLLRTHASGDLGWIVFRHGVLYAREYKYDERFEALVAEIVAEFARNFDPKRERCWIAERNGQRAGSIMLVRSTERVAKLRLLLVEPTARGLGMGQRLVEECVRFAEQVGYKKVLLWTQSELTAARKLYERAGFQMVKEEAHQSWGRSDLIAETWELKL